MKKINTNTYYLFNISLLLEQHLYIQNKINEYLCDLSNNVIYNKNKDDVKIIKTITQNIDSIFSHEDRINPILNDINSYIRTNCKHEWVYDDIDINLDKTIHIYYCNYCGITKNTNLAIYEN
jgi:NAD-dependent SIR2 family protein deacetylase